MIVIYDGFAKIMNSKLLFRGTGMWRSLIGQSYFLNYALQ
jgi:hypothetical protein